MQKFTLTCFLSFLLHLSSLAQWSYLGPDHSYEYAMNLSSIDISSKDSVFIAFADGSNSFGSTVLKFDGNSWVPVGKKAFSETRVREIKLKVDQNGIPYVAFTPFSTNKISVMKYDGSKWVYVGAPDISTIYATDIDLLIDNNNIPYIAYQDGGVGKAVVKRFINNTWQSLGNTAVSTGAIGYSCLAKDHNNQIYLAYSDENDSYKAVVKKYDGNTWSFVGQQGFTNKYAIHLSMAIDAHNTLYLSHADYDETTERSNLTVQKLNEGTWEPVGNRRFTSMGVQYTSLAISKTGVPYVAFRDYEEGGYASVMRYIDGQWNYLGDAGFSDDMALNVGIVLNSKGNPIVAYEEDFFESVSVMTYDINTSINDEQVLNNVAVYPNPCNDGQLHMKIPYNDIIRIYNSMGNLVLEKEVAPNAPIDISALAKGIYSYRLLSKVGAKLMINE